LAALYADAPIRLCFHSGVFDATRRAGDPGGAPRVSRAAKDFGDGSAGSV